MIELFQISSMFCKKNRQNCETMSNCSFTEYISKNKNRRNNRSLCFRYVRRNFHSVNSIKIQPEISSREIVSNDKFEKIFERK